ncbi:hypothetical protein [Nocardioides sp. AX2bis]|uniref:hypothetical protein n=1 Tax=Nocardioides sp. AX2bis TaxID=2653157 RepID=UPI0012F2885D|nr:hypothetical protein [Nocardioides sp. AX2bis]VXB06062.1 conserved hypothetical protein [Nocardioides sp. AX2bis]
MAAREEDFRPTNGPAVGLLALAVLVGVVVLDVLGQGPDLAPWGYALVVLLGVLVWAAVLRPRVWVGQGDLVLRTMLETVRLPLAAVEAIAVRQVLVVTAGGRRYVCPALGRSRKALVRGSAGGGGRGGGGIGAFVGVRSWGDGAPAEGDEVARRSHERALGVDYPRYVEGRLLELTDRARLEARVRPGSDAQRELAAGVRREPAWPEIAALALSAVALVVLVLR